MISTCALIVIALMLWFILRAMQDIADALMGLHKIAKARQKLFSL